MGVRRPVNRISKNPRVQRFAAMDLEKAYKKYYPTKISRRRSLTVKQFNTICYMLGATDYTVLEIAELVSKLGEKISTRPVSKINKILEIRTSEEAKITGTKSAVRKLSALSDAGILELLSKKRFFGDKEDFVHSQSDVVRLTKAGSARVNRLAQQVRTRADNLRVSKRREIELRKGRPLTPEEVHDLEVLSVQRLDREREKASQRTFARIDDFITESKDYRKSRKPVQLKTREDWVRVSKVLNKSKTYTRGMKNRLRERVARELAKPVPTKPETRIPVKRPKAEKGSTAKPDMAAIIKHNVPINIVAGMYGISEEEARKKVDDYKREHNLE